MKCPYDEKGKMAPKKRKKRWSWGGARRGVCTPAILESSGMLHRGRISTCAERKKNEKKKNQKRKRCRALIRVPLDTKKTYWGDGDLAKNRKKAVIPFGDTVFKRKKGT